MTVTEIIKIHGCKHEYNGTSVCVDLDEPETIGKTPYGETFECNKTSIWRNVIYKVEVTGKIITDKFKRRRAEVKISCDAIDCPFHKDFNKSSIKN